MGKCPEYLTVVLFYVAKILGLTVLGLIKTALPLPLLAYELQNACAAFEINTLPSFKLSLRSYLLGLGRC